MRFVLSLHLPQNIESSEERFAAAAVDGAAGDVAAWLGCVQGMWADLFSVGTVASDSGDCLPQDFSEMRASSAAGFEKVGLEVRWTSREGRS